MRHVCGPIKGLSAKIWMSDFVWYILGEISLKTVSIIELYWHLLSHWNYDNTQVWPQPIRDIIIFLYMTIVNIQFWADTFPFKPHAVTLWMHKVNYINKGDLWQKASSDNCSRQNQRSIVTVSPNVSDEELCLLPTGDCGTPRVWQQDQLTDDEGHCFDTISFLILSI